MLVVLAKFVCALVLVLVMHLIARSAERGSPLVARLGAPRPVLAVALIMRVVPFALAYLVFSFPLPTDVQFWYVPEARAAADGLLVYRDFISPYAPLFPYFLALPMLLWDDGRSIIILMLLLDVAALALTRAHFERYVGRERASLASLLYAVSPTPILMAALGGQEDVWLWIVGSLVIASAARSRALRAGLVAGVGLLCTKILLVVGVLPLAFGIRRPAHYLAGLSAIGVVSIPVLWALTGDKFLMPLSEGAYVSGPNVWFLLNALTQGAIPLGSIRLSLVGIALVVGVSAAFYWRHRRAIADRHDALAAAWVFTFAMLMLLSPKSLGNYAVIYLLPATFLSVWRRDSRGIAALLALNVLAAYQPSLWYRLGSPRFGDTTWLGDPLLVAEFVTEILMVLTLSVLAQRCWTWAAMERLGQRAGTAQAVVASR